MALLETETEESSTQMTPLRALLQSLDENKQLSTNSLLRTLEYFWDLGDYFESSLYLKEYFWNIWLELDLQRLVAWHSRFCAAGMTLESPLLAASILPFLGSRLRFSIAQLATMQMGDSANVVMEIASRLSSSDSDVVAKALVDSNDFRNKFDAATGYNTGISSFFPRTNALAKIVYDSGLDDFDGSMSVEVVPYYREAEMLQTRLEAHGGLFDSILLIEGATDYQGKSKPSYFKEVFDDEFRRSNRIRHIIVDFPVTEDPWVRERLQRDAAISLLAPLDPEAIIFSSDLDELFDVKQLDVYRQICSEGPVAVESSLITHCITNVSSSSWLHPKMFLRKHLPESLSALRLLAWKIGPKAGWHLTYFGDKNFIVDKLNAFAHTESSPDPNEILGDVEKAELDAGKLEVLEQMPESIKKRWSSCVLHANCNSVAHP